MRATKFLTVCPYHRRTRGPVHFGLSHGENVFRHGIGGLQCIFFQSDRSKRSLKFEHAAGANRLRAVDQSANRREIVLGPSILWRAPGNKLKGEVRHPRQSAFALSENL